MIEDWIKLHLGLNVKYASTKGEIHICCPVCKENRYRLYINVENGLVYCHNCQFKGSIVKLIQYVEGVSKEKAESLLKEIAENIVLPYKIEESVLGKLIYSLYNISPQKRAIPLPEEFQKFSQNFSEKNFTAKKALKYLQQRGITKKQILNCGMGICTEGEYKNRVIIPIFLEGNLQFWVARAISDNTKLKEKSPSAQEYQYSKSEVIFNLDTAAKKYNSIVISEGIFDALSWGDIGVALLGKSLYDSQFNLILKYKDLLTQGIYIALDADAVDSATLIAEKLKSFFKVMMINIPKEYDDPNKYLLTHSKNSMWELIMNAEEYTEFSIIKRKLGIFS